ncbi:MAG TPA: hypothetical protein PKD20_05180 [Candidatus Saccharibacteria bacterium]|jgi:hypothetical protein|nr:hypothetical protein [Candidatus Saccharibacteria bacterium]HMT56236.1 hypothetical protein [Candidatus Saccharibacteria bacterium]
MPYTEAELAHEADRARFYDPLILRQFRKQYDTELPATTFESNPQSQVVAGLEITRTLKYIGSGMIVGHLAAQYANHNDRVSTRNLNLFGDETLFASIQTNVLIFTTLAGGLLGIAMKYLDDNRPI